MANPQKENGYTAIANEVLDRLFGQGLTGREYDVVLFVLRKTYGFQKKSDRIALSQFEKALGMRRSVVCKTINKLVAYRLLARKDGVYSFNKNWEQWLVASERLPVAPRRQSPRGKSASRLQDNQLVAPGGHTKETITKETITKETADDGNQSPTDDSLTNPKDVADIIDIFVKAGNKTLRFGNVTQRKACERLIADIGIQKVLTRARYAVEVQTDRYAPNITTPLELEQKMHKLETYFKREKNEGGGIAIIS